jgi:hypothetical protein
MLVDHLWKMFAEIDVCRPIYHDAYDLCDMYKQKSLWPGLDGELFMRRI